MFFLRGLAFIAFAVKTQVWSWKQYFVFFIAVNLALEFIALVAMMIGYSCSSKRLPERNRVLSRFNTRDYWYILHGKIAVAVFTYVYLQFLWTNPQTFFWIQWSVTSYCCSFALPLLILFCVYDTLYMPFHWTMHNRHVYNWIHKHHHRQGSPFRGSLDAINVHPLELWGGELLYLFAYYILVCIYPFPVHYSAAIVFLLTSAMLSTLNHTRFDLKLFGYRVSHHDIHHAIPQKNYSQYWMFWDRVFSTYLQK